MQFEKMVASSRQGTLTDAELAFFIAHFNPAELYQVEQEEALSRSMLSEWLVQYKFKNWTKTESTAKPVTPEMRKMRATEIAAALADTDRWHTHGHGISMEVLRRDLNLKIDDFGLDPMRRETIRSYHRLLRDHMLMSQLGGVLHMGESFYMLRARAQ